MPATPNVKFRLELDVPHSLCLEPGYARHQHCHDFRALKALSTASGTTKDPNTGLVTLVPSFLTEAFHSSANWKPLDQWLYSADFWEKVYRAGDPAAPETAHFFSTVGHNNSDVIGTLTDVSIAGVSLQSAIAQDQMVWVMQSQFDLARDEGFVWSYRAMGDERHRYKNWFSLQWDNLLLVFSYDGRVRSYQYGSDKTQPPTFLEEFEICLPGDISGKEGYFIVQPFPGYGLNIYHAHSAVRMGSKVSSAQSGVTRGHLLYLPQRKDGANFYVHNGGKLSLGMSLRIDRHQQQFGYHAIRYPTTVQTWIDDRFDPGYKPTNAPFQNVASQITTAHGTVSCDLLNGDKSGPWTAGTDRQGHIKITMQTDDSRYTPYVIGTNIAFNPIFATRDTTPVLIEPKADTLDRLWQLEFSEDDLGHFEGTATIYARSAALRKIMERGDTTFQIEKSLDGGATWLTHGGGLARFSGDIDVVGDETQGVYYVGRATLVGMEGRFDEYSKAITVAGDNLTPGELINTIHRVVGLAQIDPLPAAFTAFRLPDVQKGQNYRFVPRPGDKGDEIIRQILFLLKTQSKEWRHYYDWKNAKWLLDEKPRDANPTHLWTLTPFKDEAEAYPADVDGKRKIAFGGEENHLFPFRVSPPEANVIQPIGVTTPDPDGEIITGTPLYNRPSLTDKTSPDYLGRAVVAAPRFWPISDLKELQKMGRRVYDAACHREVTATLMASRFVDGFKPGMAAKIRTLSDAKARVDWLSGELRAEEGSAFWLKRRSVTLTYNGGPGESAPVVIYTLSSTWESSLK